MHNPSFNVSRDAEPENTVAFAGVFYLTQVGLQNLNMINWFCMNKITNDQLIKKAGSVIATRKVGDRLFGDVGSALVTDKGNIYTGVCIDTSGIGFCAEQSAIAAMITAGENKIDRIVATWKDKDGVTFIISPCGHCREFMRQISDENTDLKVILSKDKVERLEALLPERKSWERV